MGEDSESVRERRGEGGRMKGGKKEEEEEENERKGEVEM